MDNFLLNYDNDEILYFIKLLDNEILNLDSRSQLLRDFKDELQTFLSNKEEG